MNDPGLIKDVSDTAIWVAHYRAVESERADALFHDPLAKLLTAERGEHIAASFAGTRHRTDWSVVMRTVLIDEFIQRGIADGVDAVVSLGAGLDTRPYRMALPPTFQWVEADFPHMVEFKRARLQSHTPHCALRHVGLDLADAGARQRFLAGVVPEAKKVLVLTEGVIPYLAESQVAELAADLLAQRRFCCWLVEYFSPEVYPYLRAFSNAPVLVNSPFRFFPADWTAFFLENGWTEVERHYSTEVAQRYNRLPPTTWWMRWLLPFLRQETRDRLRPRSGFMMVKPRT